ncbi:hypothetical protein IM40_10810 (plasmid) [Candidatus Paracaedimonas acanthamoebae]|nr:hypothetical protein IM40_10810 [Candidatus Paracaedimonas acanthamoebae]
MNINFFVRFFNSNNYIQNTLHRKSNVIVRFPLVSALFISLIFIPQSSLASDSDTEIKENPSRFYNRANEEEVEDLDSTRSLSFPPKPTPNDIKGKTIGDASPANEGLFFNSHKPTKKLKIPTSSLPQSEPQKPHKVDLSSNAKDLEESSLNRNNITPKALPNLNKLYRIPKETLNKKGFSSWKKCCDGASGAETEFKIIPSAVAFSATSEADKELYDYYDISLNLRITTPDELIENKFLPKEFILQVQPVQYNWATEEWNLINHNTCPIEVWTYNPERVLGRTEVTLTKGYTCTATMGGGLAANLITGGPSANISASGSTSYTSNFSFKRTSEDMDIIPEMSSKNYIKWKVILNNLHHEGSTHGFLPEGSIETDILRWVWKVNHGIASESLYSGLTEHTKDIFYFKINLFTRFALVDPAEKKKTDYLPIFSDNNGEDQQIIGINVPHHKSKKVKKKLKGN